MNPKSLLLFWTLSLTMLGAAPALCDSADNQTPLINDSIPATLTETAAPPPLILPSVTPTTPSIELLTPALPRTMPPDVTSRPPLPAPPAVALPAALGTGEAKPSLSWRAKAFKLANAESTSSLIKSAKLFDASVPETANALQKAGKSLGIDVNAQFQGSGQLLGRLADGSLDRIHLIFSVDQVGKKSTLVRAGVEPETNEIKKQLFDDLLNQTDTLLKQKELL
jgi:hypothetical protein